jgi:hypothetical protein
VSRLTLLTSLLARAAELSIGRGQVRYWHVTDMATPLADVRFWDKSGHWS